MIREIDRTNIYLNGKKYILPYRVRIYKSNIEEDRVVLEKRRGSSKTVDGKKYYLTDIENVPFEERKQNIEKILLTKTKEGNTLQSHLQFMWETKYFSKNQNNELEDECTHILETLADYYLGGFEGDNILDKARWERIKKYEVSTFIDSYSDDQFSEEEGKETPIHKTSKEEKKKIETSHPGQTLRWKSSRTKRLDNIVSYDNYYQKEEWICDQKVLVSPQIRVKYDRLVDFKRPYKALWVSVDTRNTFYFDDKEFIIKDKQYKCNPFADDGFCQDKVLCYKQDNKYYFFDMLITRLKEVEEKE